MKILFSTGTLHQLPLAEAFRFARDAGFDGCDLVVNRSLDSPDFGKTLEHALSILPAHSVHAPFMKLSTWGAHVDALRKTLRMAGEFGIGLVNFHPPSWFHRELTFYRWFRNIEDFQQDLGCGSVLLAIENMPLIGNRLKLAPYLLNEYRDLIEFGVKRNLYFTFDTTHIATFDQDAIVSFLAFHKTNRLKNVHLSDSAAAESHLFPGTGTLPIARLLNTMRRVGYDGMVTLEIAPQELPVTKELLARTLEYAASFMKAHLGKEEHG